MYVTKSTKEKETEKRDIPPTPPIESKGKEKESPTSGFATARAREEIPPVIDIHNPPTLEVLLYYAHHRLDFHDDAFICEWFDTMQNELFWHYPETGEPIRHWPAYFRLWRKNRAFFDKLRDPTRLPDARKAGGYGGPRKADNWRGTRKEDIGNVLG